MASLHTKRQAVSSLKLCQVAIRLFFKATKHTSKLLDQQLNYMEELMLWGQQNVIISEKQLSDLSLMTNDALKQKVQTIKSVLVACICI